MSFSREPQEVAKHDPLMCAPPTMSCFRVWGLQQQEAVSGKMPIDGEGDWAGLRTPMPTVWQIFPSTWQGYTSCPLCGWVRVQLLFRPMSCEQKLHTLLLFQNITCWAQTPGPPELSAMEIMFEIPSARYPPLPIVRGSAVEALASVHDMCEGNSMSRKRKNSFSY